MEKYLSATMWNMAHPRTVVNSGSNSKETLMRKKLALSLLTSSILAAVPAMAADGGAMSDAERSFLIDQMEASKKAFLASISGLSEAQWKFKPAPTVWSVA